ncbi:PCMD domain-containing protein [Sphingobacterium psychroaquaticum]|uniref:Putative carbohydrate metabolism domain-containing protein n=1 Tax=Sphingobacterium psychroaquaticum TaxID=561061 RepID=A0A1X7KZJ0_9SPHI|nr:PCMD domain-containing protein [Sphingobacterium psychroaquaticum]SMG46654.1 Putative carbohydrate metabolism domain-containing protein [Sphingobacterium psychroaquaticum]
MLKLRPFFLILLTVLFLSSCIKDEAQNMEADITQVVIDPSTTPMTPIIGNNTIVLYVSPNIYDVTKFKFDFKTTEGAKVSPAAGSEQDFSAPITYTVTSQDGQFNKQYTVQVIELSESTIPNEFAFDNYIIDAAKHYTIFVDVVNGKTFDNWASGNGGFAISQTGLNNPEQYPTTFTTTDKRSGTSAALLETKLTGALGAMFGKPIAAGNLFIGSFNTNSALLDPLNATRFGLPYNRIPLALEGYYKYSPGPKVTDKNMKEVNMADSCDIYAVLYNREELAATEKGRTYLNGGDILTHKSIVAIARLENGSKTEGTGFVHFRVPFQYKAAFNERLVFNMDYNLAIVMSSSKYGDQFLGAVGSKLTVDDIKIITQQ